MENYILIDISSSSSSSSNDDEEIQDIILNNNANEKRVLKITNYIVNVVTNTT